MTPPSKQASDGLFSRLAEMMHSVGKLNFLIREIQTQVYTPGRIHGGVKNMDNPGLLGALGP